MFTYIAQCPGFGLNRIRIQSKSKCKNNLILRHCHKVKCESDVLHWCWLVLGIEVGGSKNIWYSPSFYVYHVVVVVVIAVV